MLTVDVDVDNMSISMLNMGVGEGDAGGAQAPPHFSDTHVGGPYRCGEGAPLYSQERGFIVNYTKLMVVTEQ